MENRRLLIEAKDGLEIFKVFGDELINEYNNKIFDIEKKLVENSIINRDNIMFPPTPTLPMSCLLDRLLVTNDLIPKQLTCTLHEFFELDNTKKITYAVSLIGYDLIFSNKGLMKIHFKELLKFKGEYESMTDIYPELKL